MITQQDIQRLIASRKELEFELKQIRAHYLYAPGQMPQETQERLRTLDRQLHMIDGMFTVLTENEAFVIQRHVVDGLDWPQLIKEYTDKWGKELEKSVRSFKVYQSKALKKIASVMNRRLDFLCFDIDGDVHTT